MRGMKKSTIKSIFVSALVITVLFCIQTSDVKSPQMNFTLVAKTNGGGIRPDYLYLLREQLVPLGINLEIIVQTWPTFVGELIAFRDFDICYVGLSGGGADPDYTGVYGENGSLNLFGYHTSMDWDEELGTGKNEWYIRQGYLIMGPDSEERIQHYWEWEEYLMDKICPLMPTFVPIVYNAHWSNLVGYDYSKGIFQSWGSMNFDGAHNGQENTDQLVISDAAWSDLNPIYQDKASSMFISSACLDSLFWFDSDMKMWPHLAESYEMINDTHIRIVIRDGIKWGSDPDGNFTNEYVDAHDVYFTLYTILHSSSDLHGYMWFEDMKIIDDMTLDVYIDGDRYTPENEPDARFLDKLNLRIIPEHYLNQTQLSDGETPDITHPSWAKYAKHCFGSSLFEISEFHEGKETILTVKPDCWWLNESITNDPALDWDRRFGDFSNYMNQLKIKIINEEIRKIAEFELGKLDISGITSFPDKVKAYELNPDFTVQNDLTYSFGFFGFNMRVDREHIGNRAPCPNDPSMTIGLAIRKAISYATNRVEINNIVNKGDYLITDWPINIKLGHWCNPDIIRYDYDLYKAKELMIKAGFIIENFTPTINGFTTTIVMSSLFILSTLTYFLRRKKTINN